GFAVPIDLAALVRDRLVSTGKVTRGYLGVHIQDVDSALAQALGVDIGSGVLVTEVLPGSPAERAGVKRDDLIVSLNDQPMKSVADLRNHIALTEPGTRIDLVVVRNGERRTVTVPVAELPSDEVSENASESRSDEHDLGLQVQELTPDAAHAL